MNDEELIRIAHTGTALNVGDRVELIKGGEGIGLHGFTNGELYYVASISIERRDGRNIGLSRTTTSTRGSGFAYSHQLRKVRD